MSGNRMIITGVDDLSCGNMDAGVALEYDNDIRDYAPLDVSAFNFPGNSPKI